MHSEKLRGDDFEIDSVGVRISHAEQFCDFDIRDRVGLLTNDECEGIGAANLVLAYVTAFYDRCRAQGSGFHAYPDFYSIQRSSDRADYSMLDIWPKQKHLKALDDSGKRLEAICERGISILIVPQRTPHQIEFEPHLLEKVRRNIDRCLVYSLGRKPEGATLSIGCSKAIIGAWIDEVFDMLQSERNQVVDDRRTEWNRLSGDDTIIYQSYREIEFEEALGLI